MNVVSSNRSCRVHAVWSGWLRGAALAVACVPAAVAPYAHGLASFGVAGHFAYQIPYGRDNKPFGPWPINTSVQLEMVAGACGMPNAMRRCYYKTDLPHDPTDVHTQYAVELAQQARLFNVTLMPAIGIGGPDLQIGAAALASRGERMARILAPHGVDVWQVSDEWATPHCAINIDYKTRFGMSKSDYNGTCMKEFTAALTAFIKGIQRVSPHATIAPVAMGWLRMGIWLWMKDEGVPLTGIGLDWYSDSGPIDCTCSEYPASRTSCSSNCTNIAGKLVKLFPNTPIWITEMNRKNGACNGSAAVLPPKSTCLSADSSGEQAQADYLGSSLQGYEALAAAGYPIAGAIVYELFDQPQLLPSPEGV